MHQRESEAAIASVTFVTFLFESACLAVFLLAPVVLRCIAWKQSPLFSGLGWYVVRLLCLVKLRLHPLNASVFHTLPQTAIAFVFQHLTTDSARVAHNWSKSNGEKEETEGTGVCFPCVCLPLHFLRCCCRRGNPCAGARNGSITQHP